MSCHHSGLLLTLLAECSQHNGSVSAEALTTAIQQHQPTFRLHRNQMLRLAQDLDQAFSALQLNVAILPRKQRRSTGPWTLSSPVTLQKNDRHTSTHSSAEKSHYFYYPEQQAAYQPSVLCQFLSHFLSADVFLRDGHLNEALEHLSACETFPTRPMLDAIIDFRRIRLLHYLGRSDETQATIHKILDYAAQTYDQSVTNLAYYWLANTQYGRAPALNYAALLETMPKPQSFDHPDNVSIMYWHNLQALLLRRKILSDPEQYAWCHEQALYHFEEAIFSAIRINNSDRLMDFIANMALHLQELLPLGLTNEQDVFSCYQLLINFEDKFHCGDHSVWDHIYFTEFYFSLSKDQRNELQNKISLVGMDPSNERFYTNTLEKLKRCGDNRQRAIFLMWYRAFACEQLSKAKVREISNTLVKLINAQPAYFRKALRAEGYAEHLNQLSL
ncbi:hypothetical protein L0B52_08525 [Suttonella sp. R2A3]|uniref:hypothetical protein n=1 Tax=Suttonella sp. R2A3 TaxID=2908648 RepID=UPI001F15DC42|nr:hypothetical protein [Suttonella sp. R2A3]UJF24368.1 hypothetical protein L0B52_08525 [Suttonella sp. R2A3]